MNRCHLVGWSVAGEDRPQDPLLPLAKMLHIRPDRCAGSARQGRSTVQTGPDAAARSGAALI